MSYNYEQDQFIEYHHQVGDYPTVTPSSATGTTCGGGGDGGVRHHQETYEEHHRGPRGTALLLGGVAVLDTGMNIRPATGLGGFNTFYERYAEGVSSTVTRSTCSTAVSSNTPPGGNVRRMMRSRWRSSLGINMEDTSELGDHSETNEGFAAHSSNNHHLAASRSGSLDFLFSEQKHEGSMHSKPLPLPASRRYSLDFQVSKIGPEYQNNPRVHDDGHYSGRQCTNQGTDFGKNEDNEEGTTSMCSSHSSPVVSSSDSKGAYSADNTAHPKSFDPSSPYYSSEFMANYEGDLKVLIEHMTKSESTREHVNKIKAMMNWNDESKLKTQRSGGSRCDSTSRPRGLSGSAIKSARRKQSKKDCSRPDHSTHRAGPASFTMTPLTRTLTSITSTSPRRVPRRRSSLGLQLFKSQYFPDC